MMCWGGESQSEIIGFVCGRRHPEARPLMRWRIHIYMYLVSRAYSKGTGGRPSKVVTILYRLDNIGSVSHGAQALKATSYCESACKFWFTRSVFTGALYLRTGKTVSEPFPNETSLCREPHLCQNSILTLRCLAISQCYLFPSVHRKNRPRCNKWRVQRQRYVLFSCYPYWLVSTRHGPWTASIHIFDDDSLLHVFHLYRPFLLGEDRDDDACILGGLGD
ncbi:hypothetical protein BJV77DRAFT_96173 [Russula vinacea]|nr:hypothetical protein BJV77DRAFT_96173 [Russula vinacea]